MLVHPESRVGLDARGEETASGNGEFPGEPRGGHITDGCRGQHGNPASGSEQSVGPGLLL